MVSLRLERRTALCGLIGAVLHETASLLPSAGNYCASREAYAECASDAMDAVLLAVHESLAGFAEEWNSRRQDRVAALPRELASEIFRHLDLAGRVTISHVSALWRKAALADRALWADYTVAPRATPPEVRRWDVGAQARVLSVFLERSRPMPFSLTAHDVSDDIAELILSHIHRMKVLWLGDFQTPGTLQRLVALDIPALKLFTCRVPPRDGALLSVSHRWAGSRLQRLDISGRWLWPAGCVSLSLRSLRGTFPDCPDGTWRLAESFPNLIDLRLAVRSQADVERLDPLPPALVWMSLLPLGDRVDYSGLLRNCGAGLHLLQLTDASTASSLHEAIGLFARIYSGPWTLRVDDREVVLCALHEDPLHTYRFCGYVRSWLSRAPRALASWAMIFALDVRLKDLLDLWPAVIPGTVLPALAKVPIQSPDPSMELRICELANGAYIEAPALATVSFPLTPFCPVGYYNPRSLLTYARIARDFRAPALGTIGIEADYVETTRREDVLEFTGLTRRVIIWPRAGEPITRTWDLAAPGAPEL